MLAKSFLAYKQKGEEFDFDILKRMLDKLIIIIHPHKKGLYDVGEKGERFDKGNLNDDLIKYINTFDDFDKNLPQFLATHIEDPYRMLFRLIDKNIKKSEKIKQFLKEELKDNSEHQWLFNSEWLLKKINYFMHNFGEKIHNIYIEEYYKTNSLEKSLYKVSQFLEGINFGRTELELENFSEDGKKLLDLMIGKLIKEILSKYKNDDLKKIDEKNKFYHFLITLIEKKII
jgi:hypothetical protein